MVLDLFDGPEHMRVVGFIGMALGLCLPQAPIVGS